MRLTVSETILKLNQGEVIALPTETVYGLAASLRFPAAIENIFHLKNRPQDNPLIIHLADINQLSQFEPTLPPGFEALTERFWPGPLTFVLPINPRTIPEVVRAGLPTAAFRIPSNPTARKVIEQVGPIVMPSANISGRPSATKPEHVEEDFGEDFPVLDGGFCERGLESTIVIYKDSHWHIIRQGAISKEQIAEILDVSIYSKPAIDQPICPGQKYRHYAPRTHLIPTKEIPHAYDGAIVGYSDRIYPQAAKIYLLGSSQDPEEIARNLYAIFRLLDTDQIPESYIDISLPKDNIYLTILERIRKACA
jgi:L-threonylcarbamoyladenylate synthase